MWRLISSLHFQMTIFINLICQAENPVVPVLLLSWVNPEQTQNVTQMRWLNNMIRLILCSRTRTLLMMMMMMMMK